MTNQQSKELVSKLLNPSVVWVCSREVNCSKDYLTRTPEAADRYFHTQGLISKTAK